jgi:hypothetical protein
MAAFIPDGYLDRAGAIKVVIETRFPDERAAIDDMRQKASEMGRLPNLSNWERQLAEKAEPVLRSLLFKGSLAAIIFDEHGQDQLPAHFWAAEDADDVLLCGSHRLFFYEQDLRSALAPTEASVVARPNGTRGPQPKKMQAVIAKMIAHGDMADLAAMKGVVMEATFGASRDTCSKARESVLSELRANNPDK